MRNKWYGDKRDVVKWSVLIQLANIKAASRILQIAYFREDDPNHIEIDGNDYNIPAEVMAYFRDINKIHSLPSHVKVTVFDKAIVDRNEYLDEANKFVASFKEERCIVFLDPDTGIEPANHNLNHVRNEEAKAYWNILKHLDVLALYQHQTNRNGEAWEEPKRMQFEDAIGVPHGVVKTGRGLHVARDVVLFYAQKA
jgi:hypothetical protein